MKISIPVPEGYALPEDVEDGGEFEELVTFTVEGDSLVPTMIAGIEITSEEEDADMVEEDDVVSDMEAGAAPMAGMAERMMGMA
jgi:hypothetical protein